jgi:hypothetical protein
MNIKGQKLAGWLMSVVMGGVIVWPLTAAAHRSGCHNLHTCPSDSNQYVCGDLGYPCNGATSINDIDPAEVVVPLLVESAFRGVFGRVPSETESTYWKNRFRSDKGSAYKIKRAMRWHEARGSYGPKPATRASAVEPLSMVRSINSYFRAIYEREPASSENIYWLSRIQDKPNKQAMKDAMIYHKLSGIEH